MKPAINILEERISAAMADVTGLKDAPAIVRPATDSKFGDYQSNGVMALAKQLKTNPRKLAQEVVNNLDLSDICEKPEVAGAGFINLRLKPDFVADRLLKIHTDPDERLGIDKASQPKTIVVDFSSPNIAKEMHVGHLRSTIIGDCICRMLEFLGHNVIRQNHIGDWGTQFGMLIRQVFEGRMAAAFQGVTGQPVYDQGGFSVADTEDLYRKAKARYDSDPNFAQESREWVVKLQNGDEDAVAFWNTIVRASLAGCQEVYDRLAVTLTKEHARGESFYKDMLPDVVDELVNHKIAVKSEGAVCVFPPGFENKEGKPLPFMIQKSDGAYLYATTDLAALRYRVTSIQYEGKEYKADKIIYVTDARQKLHFEMLFATARMAGWDIKQKPVPTQSRERKTGDRIQNWFT